VTTALPLLLLLLLSLHCASDAYAASLANRHTLGEIAIKMTFVVRYSNSRKWQHAPVGDAYSAVRHTSFDHTVGHAMYVLCMHMPVAARAMRNV
jgi:uncharacterized protein YaiE (UPF0345 family)